MAMNKAGKQGGERLSPEAEARLMEKITGLPKATRQVQHPATVSETLGAPLRWWKLAAACLLLALAGAALWMHTQAKVEVAIVAHSGNKKVILPDGSLVWLAEGSTLTYAFGPGDTTRNASLKGAALFEIAKDARHPFVLTCGEGRLRVLGTSFHVLAETRQLALKVLTGRVKVTGAAAPNSVVVGARQKLEYRNGVPGQAVPLPAEEAEIVTTGTEYVLRFNHATLAEVAAALGAKYNVRIQLANKAAGACRLTIDLTDISLESSLRMVGEVLAMDYTTDDNTITLIGPGCY